jgi:hypothetical protein
MTRPRTFRFKIADLFRLPSSDTRGLPGVHLVLANPQPQRLWAHPQTACHRRDRRVLGRVVPAALADQPDRPGLRARVIPPRHRAILLPKEGGVCTKPGSVQTRQRAAQELAHPAQAPLLSLACRPAGQGHPRSSDPRDRRMKRLTASDEESNRLMRGDLVLMTQTHSIRAMRVDPKPTPGAPRHIRQL